jgi:hypothetical protein
LKTALELYAKRDRPRRICWVVPSDMDDVFQQLKSYRVKTKLRFRNGGIPVTLWVWEQDI